ncbi:Holliday junction branch migration protein RuvA [Actinomadura sp. WMMB 499]|uniref:Holliday junction branch migration protein RuvA n=1 Tax=Actinomadura sp. WMMB 499 TaxID=1219491 RepID=UPI001245E0CC|nr:Holliday junction branch migration protein RuvA [Actinomadura sp. WMMB 499]QFG26440.1 Holliday junction branch migration protein RuvA [Actinomadura sp. WMMB 499]
MIAFVSGEVAAAGPDGAVIDVHGVGLAVQCTPATLAGLRVGDRARVPTSLVVREDSLTLFGFADDDERTVFELLQTASGVGPRLALAMLAVHTPNALRRAVAAEDLTALTKVPGIGKKGAQRIVLELRDRLGGPVGDGADEVRTPARAEPWREQVQMGLVNLGWSAKDSDAAVDAVAADLDGADAPPVAALLKSALKKLSK